MLKGTIALHSPLNEDEFKALALTDSFTWKRVEQIMNDNRNKLGSNAILEYKVMICSQFSFIIICHEESSMAQVDENARIAK